MKEKPVRIQSLMNYLLNRYQLNYSRNVGKTSEEIRSAQPATLEEWRQYYFEKVRSEEHLYRLGTKLYEKIQEEIIPALQAVTETECYNHIFDLVIRKTFEGYQAEKDTVYSKIAKELNLPADSFEETTSEVDRSLGVDYIIRLEKGCIGLQIKPVTAQQFSDSHNWAKRWEDQHKKFEEKYKGPVVIVFYVKKSQQEREIYPKDVINKLRELVQKLS